MMGLKEDLQKEVDNIFSESWTTRDGTKVPEPKDLKLSNDAVKLDATILYADLAASTQLVDKKKSHFAAEIYKTYLHCAAKIIRAENGVVTAYDGDRIMGVFIDDGRDDRAVRAAMKINHARLKIINASIPKHYKDSTYAVGHAVGIDRSSLFIARTGVRGDNDLVWVGRSANYAAKLAALDASYTWITQDVYNKLSDQEKTTDGKSMWEARTWTAMNSLRIFRSGWIRTP
jgi:class 3 adenylate cyclase